MNTEEAIYWNAIQKTYGKKLHFCEKCVTGRICKVDNDCLTLTLTVNMVKGREDIKY